MPRPSPSRLDPLDAPLDELLGQVSHLRILRVLAATTHPVPPVELRRLTRLDLSGIGRAIDRLVASGIVRAFGVGRGRVVALHDAHPFAPVLRTLFDAERRHGAALVAEVRSAVGAITPVPRSAWLERSRGETRGAHEAPLRIGVLASPRDRAAIERQLAVPLRELERRYDIGLPVMIRTRADLATMTEEERTRVAESELLVGVPPLFDASVSTPIDDGSPYREHATRTHAMYDRLSLDRATRLSHAILRDPRIIERAQRWLDARVPHVAVGEHADLDEWAHILTLPPHRIAAVLRDPSERGTRLRQSSPFVGTDDDDA